MLGFETHCASKL